MSDNESVVTVDYNIDKEVEYGRKLIKDDIKNCKNCKLIHYQLKNNLNLFSEGVNENIFSYIGCSDCVDRMRYLEYDVAIHIYGLVGNNDYPKHRDIILKVLRGHDTNCCIKDIYSNAYEDEPEDYEHDFYAKYAELYDKQIHDKFEDVYDHYFAEDKVKELRKLFIDTYNNKYRYDHDDIELKDFLYHCLRIFSMIITHLNKRHVFYELMESLEFIIIDQ